jgi:hypothetical protein
MTRPISHMWRGAAKNVIARSLLAVVLVVALLLISVPGLRLAVICRRMCIYPRSTDITTVKNLLASGENVANSQGPYFVDGSPISPDRFREMANGFAVASCRRGSMQYYLLLESDGRGSFKVRQVYRKNYG